MKRYARNSKKLTVLLLAMVLGVWVAPTYADGLVSNSIGAFFENLFNSIFSKPETDREKEEPVNTQDNNGLCGDPVALYDGNESLSRTDLVVKGLFPIEITRRYDSHSTYDSNLGYGWSLSHDRRLYEYPDSSVVVRYGCGSRDRFVFTGGAYVTPADGRQGALVANPDGTFEYARRYGTREYYDAEGRITAEENKFGHRHEYIYDAAGKLPLTGTSPFAIDSTVPMTVAYTNRLTRIDERAADGVLTGNFVTLAYNVATGRLSSVTASDGRTVSYVHDVTVGSTAGNLVQVNGLEGIVSTYQYMDANDSHNLTRIQDDQGATPYINMYDTQDRVIQQIHGNDILTFNYIVDWTETEVMHTITDANGLNPYNVAETYYFDATGSVARTRDPDGNEVEFQRDAQGNLATKNYYENQGTVAVPNLFLQRSEQFTYDVDGRQASQIVTLDSGEVITRSRSYDNGWLSSVQIVSSFAPARIFRTEFTFNRDGQGVPINIQSIKRRKDDGSFQDISFVYDAKNRLVTTTLPDGQEMFNLYEGGSLYVTKSYYEIGGGESPFGRVQYGYDAHGNPNQVTDANNNVTQVGYDDLGRVRQITNALGEEVHYTYSGTRLVQTENGHTTADGEGQVTRLNYTAQGWLESVDQKDDAGAWQRIVTNVYDSAGQLLSGEDALNRKALYTYDSFGRVSTVTDPLGKVTSYTYDMHGNALSVTDGNGNTAQAVYDDLGRIIQTEMSGVTPSPVSVFTYDAAGNLLSVTDPESQTTNYTYDTLSNRVSVIQPLGQMVQHVYDDRNRVDYTVNARGHKIDYVYEPWGAISSIEYFSSVAAPTTDRVVSYSYDNEGNVLSVSDDSIPAAPLYSFTYDALNRPDLTTVAYIPGGARTLDHEYDRYGNRDGLIFTDGVALDHTYTYNKRNHLSGAVMPGSQGFSFAYYADGDLQQQGHPNGVITNYLYDDNGPVQSIVVAGAGGSIEQLFYTYDNVMNIDTLTDTNGLYDYGYDGLNRLTQASYPAATGLATESYSYDRVGNREDTVNSALYGYDANNRITQSPGLTYSFDDDGNMIGRSDGAVLTFNKVNRLSGFVKDGTTASYTYDPFGRRISKTVNGVTSWFLWDGQDLLAEFDGAGVRSRRFAYVPDQYYPAQMEDMNGVYAVHGDYLQTPRLLTDNSQNVVWSAAYQAFGGAVVNEDPDGNEATVTMNLRFPGQYYDAETGFYYNYYRYYDPGTGRYLNTDPVYAELNWYLYASNNPQKYIDPLGLLPCGFKKDNTPRVSSLLPTELKDNMPRVNSPLPPFLGDVLNVTGDYFNKVANTFAGEFADDLFHKAHLNDLAKGNRVNAAAFSGGGAIIGGASKLINGYNFIGDTNRFANEKSLNNAVNLLDSGSSALGDYMPPQAGIPLEVGKLLGKHTMLGNAVAGPYLMIMGGYSFSETMDLLNNAD